MSVALKNWFLARTTLGATHRERNQLNGPATAAKTAKSHPMNAPARRPLVCAYSYRAACLAFWQTGANPNTSAPRHDRSLRSSVHDEVNGMGDGAGDMLYQKQQVPCAPS
jgi:hypothetical protein